MISILFFTTYTFGQRIDKWNEKRESESFIEGTYSLSVSSSVELISLHSDFDEIKTGSGQELFFQVNAPAEDHYLLSVQERKIFEYYMLESKPGKLEKGNNRLGPWTIDQYVNALNISSANLGAVVKYKEDDSKYVLPVAIKESSDESKSKYYNAIFRLSKSIRSGSCRIYTDEFQGVPQKDKMVQEARIGRAYGGGTFQVKIEKASLEGYSGWVTVKLELSPIDSMKKIPFSFYFYHS